jgi:hypothetical protein
MLFLLWVKKNGAEDAGRPRRCQAQTFETGFSKAWKNRRKISQALENTPVAEKNRQV